MSTLHCSNCRIDLANDDSMKEHYKSEFHRYNIKRHLVNLPPISLEQFNKKKQDIIEARKTEKEVSLKCETCNKNFSSKATYKQHLSSSKHKEVQERLEKSGGEIILEKESPKKTGIRLTTVEDQRICLFCNFESSDVDENLVHMRLAHSFFISEAKYLKNLNGLLKYLGEKIHKGCLCIYCENHQCKDFKSGEAVQNHMMDKGHCFMKSDDFEEYDKYYDFSRSLADAKNKLLIGDANEPLKEGEEYVEMESDDEEEQGAEWEDVDEEDVEEDDEEDGEGNEDKKEKQTEEISLTKKNKEDGEEDTKINTGENDGEENKNEFEGRKERKPKRIHRFKIRKVKVLDSGEIQLPNGKILGHRKYRHIYRQYFRESLRTNYMNQKCLGANEERTVARIAQMTSLMLMKQSIDRKLRMKERIKFSRDIHRTKGEQLRTEMRANKQKHFRNENPL